MVSSSFGQAYSQYDLIDRQGFFCRFCLNVDDMCRHVVSSCLLEEVQSATHRAGQFTSHPWLYVTSPPDYEVTDSPVTLKGHGNVSRRKQFTSPGRLATLQNL